MEKFKIGGESNFIEFVLNTIHGFPDETSFEGGYTVEGTVNIQSGNYNVTNGDLWFTTGQVFQLYEQLDEVYKSLKGKVRFHNYECTIDFEISFNFTGQINIEGYFRDSSGNGRLEFNFQLDQTYIRSTLKQLKDIVEIYGGMRGIKDK